MLNKLFPKDEWKEFDLETNLEIKMESTPINKPFNPYTTPWWERQEIIYCGENTNTLKYGLFNIDLVR